MTNTPPAGTMKDARLIETEVLLPKPKRFVREALVMPDKYTHVFLACPVIAAGPARGDTEIEKYFDMSVVTMPVGQALSGIGTTITSMETVGALMAARTALQ